MPASVMMPCPITSRIQTSSYKRHSKSFATCILCKLQSADCWKKFFNLIYHIELQNSAVSWVQKVGDAESCKFLTDFQQTAVNLWHEIKSAKSSDYAPKWTFSASSKLANFAFLDGNFPTKKDNSQETNVGMMPIVPKLIECPSA